MIQKISTSLPESDGPVSIHTSVPGKVILFGEWAVTAGAPGIATTLDCRLHLDILPGEGTAGENTATRVISGDQSCSIQDEVVPGYFQLVSQVVLILREESDANLWKGKTLKFTAGWKESEGLGSSSAVVLAMLLAQAAGGTFARDHLWLRGREILRICQNPRASGLDLAAQVHGGSVILQGEEAFPLLLDFPTNLRLIHTGQKMKTDRALSEKILTEDVGRGIQESTLEFMRRRDWISAIRQHSRILENFGVVPKEVQAAQNDWMNQGWIEALKTTGAGGGDALLTWINPQHEAAIQRDLNRLGWWMNPHKWTAEAGKITDAS